MGNSQAEIDARGEQIVSDTLQQTFYQTKVNTELPGTTYIEAEEVSSVAKILVQVKSAVGPSSPNGLTEEELLNIKSKAANIGAQPYLAQVQLDNLLNPTGPVNYKNLNE
jgi:hypothetical protein